MTTIRLFSWNVNGIRAVHRKGFLDWFLKEQPDILCIQETKASPDQLPDDLLDIEGYSTHVAAAQKKGYSGVALYSKPAPLGVSNGFGIERFDSEGRTLVADYGDFILFNIYFPNGKASKERLLYKMDFYDAFLGHVDRLSREGRRIVICGDVNTAHQRRDLARPKENETVSGFLPEERAWIDKLLSHGFVDTFRMFVSEGGYYSWWDYKTRARERNVGWRIDYFFVSENMRDDVRSAFISGDVMGSDHCPIGIDLYVRE